MNELSIFVDESGEQKGPSKYYLLTLVFHNQDSDISEAVNCYERSLSDKRLPDIAFHASPLMNGHDEYNGLSLEMRKRLFNTFNVLAQNLPISYFTLSYRRKEVDTIEKLATAMKRDLASFIFERLDFFQSFDKVKIYYDGGQQVVTTALHDAIDYTLSKQATVYRRSDFKEYRLAQAADYFCAIELARVKYENREETSTDIKFFGFVGSFKKNYLKQAKRKRIR